MQILNLARRPSALFVILMLGIATATATAAASVNYDRVRSDRDAKPHARQGELVRVLLLPRSLGGVDEESNVAWLTAAAAAIKADIDAAIQPLAATRQISFYRARTRFKGDSIVPSELLIQVTGPKPMEYRIKVW